MAEMSQLQEHSVLSPGQFPLDIYVDINKKCDMLKKSHSPSPSQIASTCLCLALRRAARAVSRRYDEALRPVDLNNGQFSMLTMIAGLQPAAMQDLADGLAMDRTTLTAALKPLERRGLVTVQTSLHDQRVREVTLTAEGRLLLRKATVLWQQAQQQLARESGLAEVAPLLGQLSSLV
jgi:DNA-binding MarR family transcriptional regulator